VIDMTRRAAGPAAEAEVVVFHTAQALTRFANSAIHQNVADATSVVRLRLHLDGRTASGSTTVLTPPGKALSVVRDILKGNRSSRSLRWMGQRPVVLVVQQDDTLRALIRKAVEAEGYATLEARAANEVLTARDRSSAAVDLVITDLSQPGLAGPFGLRERLGRRTKFLYLLMSTTEASVPEEDVTFFLQNPFRGRALEEKLREILRRH
jgi:CheY-like chemotaxis protein